MKMYSSCPRGMPEFYVRTHPGAIGILPGWHSHRQPFLCAQRYAIGRVLDPHPAVRNFTSRIKAMSYLPLLHLG